MSTTPIDLPSGELLTNLPDGAVDKSASSLSLIGAGASDFDKAFNENLIGLLTNFASVSAPANPLEGQLWWSPADQTLHVYSNGLWIGSNPSAATASQSALDAANAAAASAAIVADVAEQVSAAIGPESEVSADTAATKTAIADLTQQMQDAADVSASQYTALTAVVSGQSAAITSNATALATLSGQTYSSYVFKASASNAISSMSLLAANGSTNISAVIFAANTLQIWDGTSSKSLFTVTGNGTAVANVVINGSLLVANTVTANALNVTSLGAITANLGTVTAGRIQNPAGTNFYDVANGRVVTSSGGYQMVQGAGFGASSDLIQWYGSANTAISAMTKTNGSFALATDGHVYYGNVTLATGSNGGSAYTKVGTGGVGTMTKGAGFYDVVVVSFASIPGAGYWKIQADFTPGGDTTPSNGHSNGTARLVERRSGSADVILANSVGSWAWSYDTDLGGMDGAGVAIDVNALASNYTGAVSLVLQAAFTTGVGTTALSGGSGDIQATWTASG